MHLINIVICNNYALHLLNLKGETMSYIKFNDSDTRYSGSIMPFRTQHGIPAIKIGTREEIPIDETGFKVYSENGEVLEDFSEYSNHYEGNSYSTEKDEIEYGKGVTELTPAGPSALSSVMGTLSNVSAKTDKNTLDIQEITPFVETKTAYIDDTEILFESDKQGNIVVTAIDSDGESVNVAYKRDGNEILVYFDPLELITDITLSIQ